MVIDQVDVSPLKEYTMPIFIPTNEISFSMIHQNIISNNTKEFEKSPRCVFTDHPPSIHFTKNLMTGRGIGGVCESVFAAILKRLSERIVHCCRTHRIPFASASLTWYSQANARNELYIKLWCGDFTGSQSGSGRPERGWLRAQPRISKRPDHG